MARRRGQLKAEVARLRERLQVDPGGSDRIDELQDANNQLRAENDRLRREHAELRAVLDDALSERGLGDRFAQLEATNKAQAARIAQLKAVTFGARYGGGSQPVGAFLGAVAGAALAREDVPANAPLVSDYSELERRLVGQEPVQPTALPSARCPDCGASSPTGRRCTDCRRGSGLQRFPPC